jgi:TolA-binding protein
MKMFHTKKNAPFLMAFILGLWAPPFYVARAGGVETSTETAKTEKKAVRKYKKQAVKTSGMSGVQIKKDQGSAPSLLKKSVREWIKKMKKQVARSQAKHNQLVAVASVRGKEQPDSPPLYWKGKKTLGPVPADEITEFDVALSAAEKESVEDAKKKLTDFINNHPNSALLDDAKATLSLLQETP